MQGWEYELPEDRIARHPLPDRASSRLMVLRRSSNGDLHHHRFRDLPALLRPHDLLVLNDTRVMPARLRAQRASGAEIEVLLLGLGPGRIQALVRPLRRIRDGEALALHGGGTVRVWRAADGLAEVELDGDAAEVMARQGEVPLPPYLHRDPVPEDRERYQTVYAGPLGAAAAPTAGLHFTPELLGELEAAGIGIAKLTLHVGLGTFKPLTPTEHETGLLHEEHFEIPEGTVAAMRAARERGGRVIAVGTTTTRALEAATPEGARVPVSGPGSTRLFLRPGHTFRAIDGLITNFHLPGSSLLLLVGAFVGRERLLEAYRIAVQEGYRFYSYGDAMLLL